MDPAGFQKYHKKQKLSERKVSWFTGFHLNVWKAFTVTVLHLCEKVLKKANTRLSIHWKTFAMLPKIRDIAAKLFSRSTFMHLRYDTK